MNMKIEPCRRIRPMIYAYTTPEYPPHDGWTKIGYTDRQTVEERIKQQTHTVNIRAHLEWKQEARYTDGSEAYFTDHDFHDYLTRYKGVERRQKTEWFRIDGATSRDFFYRFAAKDYAEAREKDADKSDYGLRAEQKDADDDHDNRGQRDKEEKREECSKDGGPHETRQEGSLRAHPADPDIAHRAARCTAAPRLSLVPSRLCAALVHCHAAIRGIFLTAHRPYTRILFHRSPP